MTTLAGKSLNTLRLHLMQAERMADLAQYCDSTERMQSEERYWSGIARQIRAEIARREEGWSGVWEEAS